LLLFSFHAQELKLVSKTWQQLKERVVGILGRLEEAASLSYQIKLEVGPQVLGSLFDKVATAVNS
jgi:flavin-binding protein dodecin